MKIIPYGRQYIDDCDIEAVTEVLKSDYLTAGPKVAEFEERVAAFHNAEYAVAFSNGTAALHGAYYASGITAGDEFITTPNTFAASANGGVYMGAVPVLADISIKDYNIDIEKIMEKITDKTKVITPVSYAGCPFDVKSLKEALAGKEIMIIHDAAHAAGALLNGADICDYADMAMLSFHPVKHVATGEGGIILTNKKELYEKLMIFRTHGITRDPDKLTQTCGPWYYEMQELGFNYRLTDVASALGISQMDKLNNSLHRRNVLAVNYNNELNHVPWLTLPLNLFDFAWLETGKRPYSRHSYHLYPLLLDEKIDRKDFFNYMRSENIFVQVHYIPLNYMPYYQKTFGFKKGDCPVAENFYEREISIPMFPSLKSSEQEYVIEKIKNYTGGLKS